jgi:hypothetical protein
MPFAPFFKGCGSEIFDPDDYIRIDAAICAIICAHPDIDSAYSVPVAGKPALETLVFPAFWPVACEARGTGL